MRHPPGDGSQVGPCSEHGECLQPLRQDEVRIWWLNLMGSSWDLEKISKLEKVCWFIHVLKAFKNDVFHFFRTSILKFDDVSDVITEAPGKLSNSILLFVKGLGWLTSVNLPNVERRWAFDSYLQLVALKIFRYIAITRWVRASKLLKQFLTSA